VERDRCGRFFSLWSVLFSFQEWCFLFGCFSVPPKQNSAGQTVESNVPTYVRVNITASESELWAWQLQQAKLQPTRHLLVGVSDLRRRHYAYFLRLSLFFSVLEKNARNNRSDDSLSFPVSPKQRARLVWRYTRSVPSCQATTAPCCRFPGETVQG